VYNLPDEGFKKIPYKWIWLERVEEKDDELLNFGQIQMWSLWMIRLIVRVEMINIKFGK
jgi:hypothetical protein